MPAGIARTTSYNLEAISGLIRALPPASSLIVQNQINEKSARLGKPLTAVQLSRFLNMFRHSINKDISRNGVSTERPTTRTGNRGWTKKFSSSYRYDDTPSYRRTYQVSQTEEDQKVNDQENEAIEPMQDNDDLVWDEECEYKESGMNPTLNNFEHMYGSNNRQDKTWRGSLQERPCEQYNKRHCLLCGEVDHTATDGCPNMISDQGRRIYAVPSNEACTDCPSYVYPRLFHNPEICPFRVTGIWGKSEGVDE
jgi:hypothetical protein